MRTVIRTSDRAPAIHTSVTAGILRASRTEDSPADVLLAEAVRTEDSAAAILLAEEAVAIQAVVAVAIRVAVAADLRAAKFQQYARTQKGNPKRIPLRLASAG